MLDITEYTRRVNYNTQVLKDALANNESLATILTKVYTFDKEPDTVHFSLLMPKWADIIPAVFLGHLAIIDDKTGADGLRLCAETGEYIETEYKITTFYSSKLNVGINGGMSIGNGVKPTGISSYLSASYTIHSDSNLYTKNRETYLCITDADCATHDFIAFYKLSGVEALDALKGSDKKKRQICFGKFKQYGEQVKTVVPVLTWHLFKAEQLSAKHPDDHTKKEWEEMREFLTEQLNMEWQNWNQEHQ